jgi:hypothetical protein
MYFKTAPLAIDLLKKHFGWFEMKLYRSPIDLTRWFAFGPVIGWVSFPAEIGGWQERQPAPGVNRNSLYQVPLRMGFNTGIPGAPILAGSTCKLRLRVACMTVHIVRSHNCRVPADDDKVTFTSCKLKKSLGRCRFEAVPSKPSKQPSGKSSVL